MTWKQPIPTQIEELEGNAFAETIFQKILIRCANSEREVKTSKGVIVLRRGECLFGRAKWNEMFGLASGSKKIEKELKTSRFLDRYVDRCIDCGKGTVLRVKEYDRWVAMDRNVDTEWTRCGHDVDSNKIDKIDKSEESDKRGARTRSGESHLIKEEVAEEILAYWNQARGGKLKSITPYRKNITFWLENGYELEDIKQAIDNIDVGMGWADSVDLELLLRRRNRGGEDVDYIGRCLSKRKKVPTVGGKYADK